MRLPATPGTFFVDVLDARVAAVAERGVEPAGRETYSNGVRKITYRDPYGNEIGFGGGPPNDRDCVRPAITGSTRS